MFGVSDTLIELWLLNCVLAYSTWVVLNGGAFSFASVAFIAIGAYVAGLGATEHGLSLGAALVVAPIVCGFAALVVARLLERLSGVYLAIASVSLVGLVQVLLVNLDGLTHGPQGIVGIPLSVGPVQLVVAVVVLAGAALLAERSIAGKAIRLVRIDPLVASAMGVNVRRLRLWVFVASAVIGGIAGVLRAEYFGFVTPDDYGFTMVIQLLAMVVIGGVASWAGPMVGAAIFTILPEWLHSFGDWRDVITGALLLVIMIISREGIVGLVRVQVHRWRRRGVDKSERSAIARRRPTWLTAGTPDPDGALAPQRADES